MKKGSKKGRPKGPGNSRTPLALVFECKRRCLKCQQLFSSLNKGNRICADCSLSNARVSYETVPKSFNGQRRKPANITKEAK